MMNIDTLKKTYIVFNSVGEFEKIIEVFNKFGFGYKNGTLDDAMDLVNTSVVNKIICHDKFIVTSKEKVTTISYKVFMKLSNSFTSEEVLLNNNNKNTMRNSASKLNTLRAAKVFKDEKKLAAIVKVADDAQDIADNFIAALRKSEAKGTKVLTLIASYEDAVEVEDIKEIARLGELIESSIEFITNGNKVLAALNSAGKGVVKAEAKTKDTTGEKFIGE